MAAQIFQLIMRAGPTPGKTFFLEKDRMVLGRDLANDIAISDPEVSRSHASFSIRDEGVFIEDLGSTNGSFLNGERISTPQQLRSGDVITLGENIVLLFEKGSYDPNATVVGSQAAQTVQKPMAQPEPVIYQQPPEPVVYQQPDPAPRSPGGYPPQTPAPARVEQPKKGGLAPWLVILLIAIVVLACIIAVVMWFMPATWWCAISFDMLEGCPIP